MRLRHIGLCLAAAGLMITCTDDNEPPPPGTGNPPPTADEMLADRQVSAAADAYEADVAANPNDLGARFGAAFTRFMLLPELPGIEQLLTQCGQPGVDVQGQLFGPNGYFSHTIGDREGSAAVTLTRAPAGGGTPATVNVALNRAWTRVYSPGTASQNVSVHFEDAAHSGEEGEVDFYFYVSASELSWAQGQTYDLSTHPWLLDMGIQMDVPGAWFWVQTTGGTITVNQAGTLPGQTIELQLNNVTFDRWRDDASAYEVDATYTLSGTLTDDIVVEFEPAPNSVPFMDLDDDPGPPYVPAHIQVFETCNPALSVPRLLEVVDEVAAEIDGIRGHLDVIAASGSSGTFRWELPVGAVANTQPIPVGITEVHLLRGLMHGAHGLNALAQEYHYVDATFPSMITTYTEYLWDGSRTRRDFDLELVAPQLNADFLRVTGAIDVATFRDSLQAMLEAGKAALLATPSGDTLLNFQKPAAQAASAELVDLADTLIASLTTPQTDDSGNYTFHPSNYFTNPFDRSSMRAAVGGDLWLLTTRDAISQRNADVQADNAFGDELLNTFLTIDDGPISDIFCTGDVSCASVAPTGSTWHCNEWVRMGVCSNDLVTVCDPWDFPDVCAPNYCVDSICGLADPILFDEEIVTDAFDADPPAFINESLLQTLEDAF